MKYYIEHEVTSGALQGVKFVVTNDADIIVKTEDNSNVYTTDKKNAEYIASILNAVDDKYGIYEAKLIEEYDDYPYFKHTFDETLHYIQWLSKEVLDKVLVNTCKRLNRTNVDAHTIQYILGSNDVATLFDWSATKEGHDYWKRISQAIANIRLNVL